MGKLYLQGVCFLISSLASLCSAAEQQYFLQDWSSLMWDEARSYCQVCFKDLVTVTPENIKSITQNLSSDCWVGLRKNFSSSAGDANMSWSRWADGEPLESSMSWSRWADEEPLNHSMSWSRWADGEPLIFQNWYPGWPALASTPEPGGEAECVSSMEDSCVAMLSFGAWVERNCSDLLPFICYEDRFFGRADVTNVTSERAVLTWLPAPGVVGHYRVEVKVDDELKQYQSNSLTFDLANLTAGTHYSVQVFPVKCTRALDPQEIAFYTTPNKVEDLSVTNVTETSVFLSWSQPAGHAASYLIEVRGEKQIQNKTEGREICRLTPGNRYTFTVLAGAGDNATWSEESSVTEYTRPGRVSYLKVSEHTTSSLLLRWLPPHGNTSGFRVTATSDRQHVLFDDIVTQTEATVAPLPPGSRIALAVTALTANNTLEGRRVTADTYTAPGPISNLTLNTTDDSLTATWSPPEGNSLRFTVELRLEDEAEAATDNLTEPRKLFEGLKAAANYTLTVAAWSGPLRGPEARASKFTDLLPPTNASVNSSDKHQITFQWSAPNNTARAKYSVRVNSSFWGHDLSEEEVQITSHRFDRLNSGTKYDFEVRTVADGKSSSAAVASHYTDAEKREIGLSMSCSSLEPLLCDQNATREHVFHQFGEHVKKLLGGKIFLELEKQETEGKGAQ